MRVYNEHGLLYSAHVTGLAVPEIWINQTHCFRGTSPGLDEGLMHIMTTITELCISNCVASEGTFSYREGVRVDVNSLPSLKLNCDLQGADLSTPYELQKL